MESKNRFVTYLEQLRETNDRGALAALRRGVGKPPGTVIEQYPLLVPRIPPDVSWWNEKSYYLIGGLFAFHPDPGGKGNLGDTFRTIMKRTNSESIEKRFVALLNCHPEDLYRHLRHAVALAKSKDIPVEWDQLFRDIRYWNHPDQFVQKRWAKSFWASSSSDDDPSDDQIMNTSEKNEV